MTAGNGARGYYVYGVTDAGAEISDAVAGARPIDPGSAPFLLAVDEVAAVVSAVPLDDFDEAQLAERLNDPEWLLPRVSAHEDVLEHVLGATMVVPLRFGTVYRDEASVRAFLSTRSRELGEALRRLAGRVELGVKAYVDPDAAASAVRAAEPEVAELEAQLAAAPEGMSYMLRRRIDQLVDRATQRLDEECAEDAHAALSQVADDARLSPLRPNEPGDSRRMILNGAYLVADADALVHATSELERRYGARGVTFEVTGPWPPYNFVEPDPE